jgi:putative tricarboxylic transport membrane protein
VDIMVIEPQEAGEQVRAGKLRVLAQLTDARLPGWPDVPTLKEAGYDVQTTPQIRAVVAPPEQPAEASAYWEKTFDALRKSESWKKYVADNQLEEHFTNGAELKKTMVDIEKQLKDAYTQAGIKTVR